ncbi:MAG: hypothetical protein ABIU86_04045 [Gemmatimonadaceae bacterium]
MRKPRPNTYNPAQVLHLISRDRSGTALSCPSCSGTIERDPRQHPPRPMTHVTLRCSKCGRIARYVAGAA